MKIAVEKDTLEKVVTYLSTKPWAEVQGLIVLLSKSEMIEEKPKLEE